MKINIEPYLLRPRTAVELASLEHIFFSSSATQQFSSAAERAAFQERWLGRYLLADATHAFLAVGADGALLGYVIGAIDDIARLARFADIASARQFAQVSARYPAHLHINVDQRVRGQGIGARLIEAFAAHASALGAPGMHVVTGAASRNMRFYRRCGFHEAASIAAGGSDKVFLARDFRGTPPPAINA